MEKFYNYMNHEEQRIRAILNQNNAMIELTAQQQNIHTTATICDTCNKEFTPIRLKTKHHCHVTGRYLGPVCQSCNLQLKCRTSNNEFFVPCFFHNSSAYDSHLIIKHLHKKQSKITVIPSNTEQFIGFQIDGIRYLTVINFCRQVWMFQSKICTMTVLSISNTCNVRLGMEIQTFSRRESIHMSI